MTFAALIIGVMGAFVILYEASRARLSKMVLSRYRSVVESSAIAFISGILTAVLALLNLLDVSGTYWLSIAFFGLKLTLTLRTGIFMYRATR